MTDQLTPTGHQADDDRPSFAPPRRSERVKSEIMAGGSVTERTDDELANGWTGYLAMAAILALFAWLATINIWIFVFVVGLVAGGRQLVGHRVGSIIGAPAGRRSAVPAHRPRSRRRRCGG